jgi:hypothetical protein
MRANTASGTEIRSEQRGPHWIAWVADAHGKPAGSVILVGRSREEAEARARQWSSVVPHH